MKFDWTYFRSSDLPARMRVLLATDMELEIHDSVSGKNFRLTKTASNLFQLESQSHELGGSDCWDFVMRADLGRLLYLLGIFKS